MKHGRYSVVFAGEAHAGLLRAALPRPYVCVTNRARFLAEIAKPGAVAFVDSDLFHQVDGATGNVPVIGILDEGVTETLSKSISLLDDHPWLSHVLVASLLSAPFACAHIDMVLERLPYGNDQPMLGSKGIGRVALLARASRREARLERMREFFAKHGLSARTIETIADVSEELVTNALYDAPVEAGYFERAVPRTEDVDLPLDKACEISYGIEKHMVFVRLRDMFGALSRTRLLEVLNRCNSKAVTLDESRGGAGLGLWRVFSAASTIAITVTPGSRTDIVVGFATKDGRITSKQLLALDLFFVPKTSDSLLDSYVPDDDRDLIDNSITLVLVA